MNLKDFQNNPFFQKTNLKKDEIIIKQGQVDDNIFIVLSGNLEIYKEIENQKNRYIAKLKTGDIFGEGSLSGETKKEVRSKQKLKLIYYI